MRVSDGLERQAPGDGMSELPAFQQSRQFAEAGSPVCGRQLIDQKESQSDAVEQQPMAGQAGSLRFTPHGSSLRLTSNPCRRRGAATLATSARSGPAFL